MAGKREAVREAVAQAGGIDAAVAPGRKAQDPFTGELRRRAILPLLVLHLINEGPSYGNQLMERIGAMTAGVLSVNPNTMYPLLRQLEATGADRRAVGAPRAALAPVLLAHRRGPRRSTSGSWRRCRPFLDSVKSSIDEIVREVYGR